MAKKKNSSPTYGADDERMIRESFETAVHRVRNYFNPDAVKTYDLFGAVLKRRKSATLSVLPEVTERYGHYYQDESDLKSDFICLCTSVGYFLDNMDIRYYITTAAAIWMLDELKQNRLLNQALPYFSADADLLETISIPDMIDPSHDNLVIQAMMELIQDRDDRPSSVCRGQRRYAALNHAKC